MAELRWNPMIKDWVMIASHRQNRPNMPKDWCPFCPGSGKVPEDYDVHVYDNDFPALSQTPPPAESQFETDFYKMLPAHGKCEVVLFSPKHNGSLNELADDKLGMLVDLWQERYIEISKDEKIKYVFIFENRGDVVGVTMPHPHGQIYGYSVVPKKIEVELDAAKEHFEVNKGECIFCHINKEENEAGIRIICENDDFIAYIPFFADYTYGVYIVSKLHKNNLADFNQSERLNLGRILRDITGAYDNIFDYKFPYMMCMHNGPVNMENTPHSDHKSYYHFHIELYPPMRSADKQQFQASSETGVWAHCNPTSPEEKAEELRSALERFRIK